MPDKEWTEVTAETNSEVWARDKPIEGQLVKVQSGVGPNESMLYTLKTDSGNVSVWGSTVLDTKFAEIENGSMVKIEPQGEVKSEKTQRKYQDYKVFTIPPAYKEIEGAEPLPEPPDNIPF